MNVFLQSDAAAELSDPVVENVRRALAEAGLPDTVLLVPDSVATAATAAAVLGCEVGAIANSLIFECGGAPLLIMASGAAKVDTKKVARENGLSKINRAGPDFVLEHAGQPVGGVALSDTRSNCAASSTPNYGSTPCFGLGPAATRPCSRSAMTSS